MSLLLSICFIISGLFLLWQGCGFLGLFSWCTRLVVSKFNMNIFCVAAGSICSQFGILLGVVAIALGVLCLFDKKSGDAGFKNRGSYLSILIFILIFCIITIL